MRRSILLIAFIALCLCGATAKSFEVDALRYTIHGKNVSVGIVKEYVSLLTSLELNEAVVYDGKYYVVNEIDQCGFADCANLESISIPNSVTKIGAGAFANCVNLRSAVLPDVAKVVAPVGFYAMVETRAPFAGCISLTEITGHNVENPSYVIKGMLRNCPEVPFASALTSRNSRGNESGMKKVAKVGGLGLLGTVGTATSDKGEKSASKSASRTIGFKEFAKAYAEPALNQWQERKEYESAMQWQERVNDRTREHKISQLLEEAKEQYISRYAPKKVQGRIEGYDPDYNIFTINTAGLGNVYVKVPAEEERKFSSGWGYVKIEPTYGIRDNTLAIIDCKFKIGKKTYSSPTIYAVDDIDGYDYGFQSLESYIADGAHPDSGSTTNVASVSAPRRQAKGTNDPVDLDIPSTGVCNDRTFAVIIGNENYVGGVPAVDFAANDAEVFAKYCSKTLGLPEKNVRKYINVTYGGFLSALRDMESISKAFKGDVKFIFYYAGHGAPDVATSEAYLMPVDADGQTTEVMYSLRKLYSEFSKLKSKGVTVFLDACFSGATRDDSMLGEELAARGVRIRTKDLAPEGNVVVMTAATGRQTAFPYKEKGHGMFTYYLLDKLRETKGDVSLGELFEHVSEKVAQGSVINHQKSQVPTLVPSVALRDTWENIRLR